MTQILKLKQSKLVAHLFILIPLTFKFQKKNVPTFYIF